MTGSLRYLLAALFVAAYFLVPDADHHEIASLEIRSWLLDGDESPFATYGDALPGSLRVEWRGDDRAELVTEREARLASTLREWARGQGRELPAGDGRQPLQLLVRVGDNGFRAELPALLDQPPPMLERFVEIRPGLEDTGYYPDRNSLIPALLAIALAIATGSVIPALLLGCLAGAMVFRHSVLDGAWHLAGDTIASDVLYSQFNVEILGFVVFLFMTVGVMTRSGGVQGMVDWVRRFAKGPISTQLCSFAIGLLVFFDDYSNCIITGTTMRPLTDRIGVAREKLAYIVDSTAAPIAGVSIFSTWVAYEVSTFATQLPEVTRADGTPYTQADGFGVFIETLPFRFYCLFTLMMVPLTIVMNREFGPMLKAARRAWHERKPLADDAQPMVGEDLSGTEPPEDVPIRGLNALLPILLLVGMTITLIFTFGSQAIGPRPDDRPWFEHVVQILGEGQSQRALCWSSFAALLLAIGLAVVQGILKFGDAIVAAIRSAKSLLFAIIILVLAWSIAQTCKDLGTAAFLTAAFQGSFEPWLLPVVMFMLSATVAFSTGTSYGTMAILLPNVVVLAHGMGESMPEVGGPVLMVLTIGAVLEGAIFGDHCSPISDTTVLSSVATGSDHLHHVRTQAPYALTVMGVAVVCGYLPAALLGPWVWPYAWICGFVALVLVIRVFGRSVTAPETSPATT